MTREQQERIVELRLKGLGYKAIANDLGTVSKESVRYYCKNHGLGGSAALVTMNYDLHREMDDHCKYCGAKLVRNKHSGVKLFCSEECRRAWWKHNPEAADTSKRKRYECQCQYCKRTFISVGKPERKYCSRECYVKMRFWTDPDEEPTQSEIRRRQEAAKITEREPKLILKQISRAGS